MGERELIIEKLKDFKKDLAKNNIPVKKLFLFGSFAIGDFHKDSDIDLVIVSSRFSNMNFFERGALMYSSWKLDYPVDFICYTPEEFNRLKKGITIVKEAVDNGVAI